MCLFCRIDTEQGIGLDTLSESPSTQFYSNLQLAFDFFNERLFGGQLPTCMLTLRSSNRIYGYHHSDRFISKQGKLLDELGLHPGYITLRPIEMALSTLVHEMVHHWQHHFGNPTRSNPHNAEWVGKMESVGLIPSNSGLPGGKKTGKSVSHYIEPEGPFIQACRDLVATGYEFGWYDRHGPVHSEDIEAKQTALVENQIIVPFSPAPVKVIEKPEPKLGKGDDQSQAASPPSVYGPSPKRPSNRIKLMCGGCGISLTVNKELALKCASCDLMLVAQI